MTYISSALRSVISFLRNRLRKNTILTKFWPVSAGAGLSFVLRRAFVLAAFVLLGSVLNAADLAITTVTVHIGNGQVLEGATVLVSDGKIARPHQIRLLRDGIVVWTGRLASLRRFKDDVREVSHNYECGVVMDFPEVQAGDLLEVYQHIETAATL